ncbi:MAG: glycosyltransferase family 4 protein [Waterburya sp.]
MHIALTVEQFNQLGGIERVTVQLALSYRQLGHEVTVLTSDWDKTYEEQFNFIKVNAPQKPVWRRNLAFPKAITQTLSKGSYDFIHAQGASSLKFDLTTLHSVHAAWMSILRAETKPWSRKGLARRLRPSDWATIAIERIQAKNRHGFFHACSRIVQEEALHFSRIPPERIKSIPWGVDLETFQPNIKVRAQERQTWGVDESDIVLLFVANAFVRKGLDTILSAIAKLGKQQLHLMIVGRDNPQMYLSKIEQLGLKHQVHFLGYRSVIACYQAADIFVLPTTYEPWGLVISEALACGLPVITSSLAGAADLITPGENGILLNDPRSVQELAKAIDTLLAPERLNQMVKAARPSVQNSSWLEVSRQILALKS